MFFVVHARPLGMICFQHSCDFMPQGHLFGGTGVQCLSINIWCLNVGAPIVPCTVIYPYLHLCGHPARAGHVMLVACEGARQSDLVL